MEDPTDALTLLGLPALPMVPEAAPLPVIPAGVDRNDVKGMAEAFTPTAMETLVDVACNGATDSARVAAASVILERGHGKTPQGSITLGDGPSKIKVEWT